MTPCAATLSFSDKPLADAATHWHESGSVPRSTCAALNDQNSGASNLGEWIMMAFMFFLVWMLASLALLTLWVFRQTPSTPQETASTAEG
jgi:hypothetical protein